jgi:hypothetical protein
MVTCKTIQGHSIPTAEIGGGLISLLEEAQQRFVRMRFRPQRFLRQ